MSKEASYSLVNLGGLAKPIDTLIHKISDATGVLYEPTRIKRKTKAELDAAILSAKAEAAADIIKTQSEIEITDLHRRAAHRWIEEEAARQTNMEDIIAKAVPHLDSEAKPDGMEDDWIANFFDKCRIVSDSEMQSLWSRLLAGEANAPGTYSKRTVNLLSEFDKSDAELFTKLCGFGWTIENVFVPVVFDNNAKIYNRHGIDFNTLSHLESFGLVRFELTGIVWPDLPKKIQVHYYGKVLCLEMLRNVDNGLRIGKTFLTKIGQELVPICGSEPVDGFYEHAKDHWQRYLIEAEDIEASSIERGHVIVNEMVGLVETDSTDGSVNHDKTIYELDSEPR